VDYEVADARTALPFYDIGAKALICESFSGVEECVLCLLEVDEIAFGGRRGRRDFVGVVDSC
jgi:hypothetical protein